MATKLNTPPRDAVDSNRKDDAKSAYPGNLKKYRIGTYEYPEGLRIDSDKQHYIVFKVLVRDKSKLGQELRSNGGLLDKSVSNSENKQVFGGLSQNEFQAGFNNTAVTLGTIAAGGVAISQAYDAAKDALKGNLKGTNKIPAATSRRGAARAVVKAAAGTIAAGLGAYAIGKGVEAFGDSFNYSK